MKTKIREKTQPKHVWKTQSIVEYVPGFTNSRWWCRLRQGHPPARVIDRSLRSCTSDYCWPERSWQPSPGERTPDQPSKSCQLLCHAESQPAGWWWTDRHVSVSREENKKRERTLWSLASAHREVQQGNAKLQRYTRTNTNMFTHPQERVQRAVLHVLCDDHYRFALVENKKQGKEQEKDVKRLERWLQVWMKRFSFSPTVGELFTEWSSDVHLSDSYDKINLERVIRTPVWGEVVYINFKG